MIDIHRLFHDAGFEGDWTILQATEGSSGRTSIARQPGRDIVIELADRNVAQERLAEIGVTPPLLAQGWHQGSPYSITPLVNARVPEPAWFGANLGPVMDLARTWQRDERLADRLGRASAGTLGTHLGTTIEQAAANVGRTSHAMFCSHDVVAAVDRLSTAFTPDETIGLTPSHTDPNSSYFLVTADRLHLIDWDGVTLSDPMRDLGLILWWCVPEGRWPEAFARPGMSPVGRERAPPQLYWRIASSTTSCTRNGGFPIPNEIRRPPPPESVAPPETIAAPLAPTSARV